MFRLILIPLLAVMLPIAGHAQQKQPIRTCRILYLNPPPNAPKQLYIFDGVKSQEVKLSGVDFSDVYQVSGAATAIHFLDAPVATPEEIPAGAPRGKLAPSVSDFYIVATGDSENKVVPIRIQVIDAGSGKFRKGQMMWYNLTSNPMGGQLGNQKLAIKPQSRAVVDAPARGNEPFDVNLSYTRPNDPKFYPIIQTKWVHDPRSRMLIFVYGGANNTAPQISGFKDFRDAEKESE